MATLTLRPATPDDAPFLRRMQWEALLASPGILASRGLEALRSAEERIWAAWPEPGAAAFVAEDEAGEPVGAVILRVHERDGERIAGYRLAIAVEPAARGRGIGRRLLARAQSHARESGARYLLLYVDAANAPAIRAYQATGFQFGDPDGIVPMIARFPEER